MRLKTQTFAIAVCFAIASIQLVSCKKDAAKTGAAKSAELEQNLTDSTTSLDSGLVAWYTFDSDILDHSGHNNNIVFNSATRVAGKAGIPKTAFRFDGVSNYMIANNDPSLSPRRVTLYAIFKPTGFYTGPCHYNSLISKGYSYNSNGRYSLGYDDQQYYNYLGCDQPVQNKYENFFGTYGDGQSSTGATDTSNFVKLNQWYSLVYTYNGAASKLYINGVLVTTTYTTTSYNANLNNLYIGRNEDQGNPYYFKGIIDEIRIYNRALNRAEVKQLYKNSSSE